MRRIVLVMCILGTLALVSGAYAQLAWYDGFDYTPSLASQPGGEGGLKPNTPWFANQNDFDVTTSGLSYRDANGRMLIVSGNAAAKDATTPPLGPALVGRHMSSMQPVGDARPMFNELSGTYYITYLVAGSLRVQWMSIDNAPGPGPDPQAFVLRTHRNTGAWDLNLALEVLDDGSTYIDNKLSRFTGNGKGNPDDTHMIALRVVNQDGADELTVIADPDLANPDWANPEFQVSTIDFNANKPYDPYPDNPDAYYWLKVYATVEEEYDFGVMDEFRIGREWADVSPVNPLTGPGTVSGDITLEDFTPVPADVPVSVRVELIQGGVVQMTSNVVVTDVDGFYGITGVPDGTYDVKFQAAGWLSALGTAVVGTGGTGESNISLKNGDVDGDDAATATDANLVIQNMP